MLDKIKRFLSECFGACRVLAKRTKNQLAVLWKRFWQSDKSRMLYVFIAADLLAIAVLVTVLLSLRSNREQSAEAPVDASPTAAAILWTTPTPEETPDPSPSSTLTPTPAPTPKPMPTSTPTPRPTPTPKPTPTPTPPPITPPASGSQNPASPSDVVLVTAQPVSDTDIPAGQ